MPPPEWQDAFKACLPARRFGQPEEITATALLLAGPNGGFYVGACLSPYGGDVMHQKPSPAEPKEDPTCRRSSP